MKTIVFGDGVLGSDQVNATEAAWGRSWTFGFRRVGEAMYDAGQTVSSSTSRQRTGHWVRPLGVSRSGAAAGQSHHRRLFPSNVGTLVLQPE